MSVPPESVVPPPSDTNDVPAQERTWAMMAHLSALLGALVSSSHGGGFACFVGPLIIWLIKKDSMPFVNDQAKEALNFNLSVAIATLVLVVLSAITFGIGLVIAIPMWVVIGVGWLVLTIMAAVKANDGVRYRYPFTLRLIK
ncbi:DUF4870 domain-containing protein [Dyella sp. M7H15-1]|uniref:DUF4870 domain-containing protein n=1 Tax=Dyella sp. M7H15-1 TaxID=2501295 RepID=UPI001004F772|nr:DUF4870 domain-containing protein [Dyella sp. M7H15-1]QAU25222.1 DUF4870 domain-containing protein [Dyella sp. M7H15-1]